MDVASFHKTTRILNQLKEGKILPALIPPGCTSLLEPLDTAVNKPFKEWLREASDEYVSAREDAGADIEKWTTRDRRIMTTFIVATAAKRLAEEKRTMVQQAFIQCGISIRPDGTEDSQIKIKDIASSAIDFSGWRDLPDGFIKPEEYEEIPEAVDEMEEFVTEIDAFPLSYNTLKVEELKTMCKERGLPASGKKADLISRLQARDVAN
jgi:hypothetical protein